MHWGNNQRSMLTLSRKGQNIRCDFDRFGRRRVNVINYETTCSNMDNYMRGEGNFEVEPLSELRCSCRSIPLSVFNAKKENTRRHGLSRQERDTVFARLVCIKTTGIQQTFNEALFTVLYEINYSTPNEYKLLFNKAILTSSLEYRGRV